jgi:hypothetical protein
MADLSSILGGMVQGFKDFGTGLVDMFGTGGAAIGDAIASIQSGRATTKNQDDFRKWLYNTDSTKDAAAKGLGTALNGVSTVADVIPGAQAVTANPLFNGLQGAIGGISDELKMAGENADWGKAAQRAGVGAASGLASGYAGQALGKSGNKLLSNGLTRGAVSGALGGGIANAGYTGIEGGSVQDMINAGLYGAQTGALVGGTTGLARELIKPAHKMDAKLTDAERQARIENAQAQIDELGPVPLFSDDPEYVAKRARKLELNDAIKAYRSGYDTVDEYNAAMAAKRANKREYKAPEAQYAPRIGEEVMLDATQAPEGYTRLYRGLENEFDPKYVPQVSDNGYGYESWSDTYDLAREYAGPNGNVYTVDVPNSRIATQTVTPDGERMPVVKTDKKAGMKSFDGERFIDGKEYLLNVNDPLRQELTYSKVKPKTVADLMNEPKQKTVADLMLSPEQEEFFKDSQLRDGNGKLMRVYHSSPNKFTTFDDSKLGSNTAYDNTAFGHFVTSDEDFSRRFRNIDGNTDEGYTMELYANAKKPITHPYEAAYKYSGDELDNIVKNYYKETDNPEALAAIKEWADESGQSLYDAYMDMSVDENPFEMAAAERQALQGKGYDAVEFVEGRKSGLVDGSTDNTPISSYAVFSGNQLKDVNNLKPTADADIMRSVALPGSNKKAKITNGVKRIGSDNVAPVDESTLPKGWKELRDILDEKYVDDITKKFGYENGDFSKITPEQYEKYILDIQTSPGKKKGWQNQFEYKKSYMDADEYKKELKNIAIYEAKRKAVNDIQNMDLPQAQKNAIDTAINSMDYYATDDNRRYLSHYMPDGEGKEMFANNAASEADAEFSDRLGIGRSNTIKRNNIWSEDLNADGEYMPSEYALTVDPLLNKENAVSTLAHERLHSFQFEAPQGRYDKRVLDAYNELSKDLKPYLHDQATIDERYGKYYKDNLGGKYWASNIEQESRMMQQYLDNKGYTNRTVDGPRKNEYGEEINPAFDKFFKKLRTLSKKGVALPAITALLGGGAIMAATQSDDKKKKSEVK